MIHLISYGNHRFENAKKRIKKEALETGWFDTVTIYGPEHLDDAFKKKYKDILKLNRGAGYWIWKSNIIKQKLEEINENDILIYMDSGCSINKNGEKRFYEYIDLLNNSNEGIISFQMPHLEKKFTTKEIFDYFKIHNLGAIANSGQILGGIRIMKKNENLKKLLFLERKVLEDNSLLFTDKYNKNQEAYFVDNRHEQSVFSVIRKMGNPIILEDETYFTSFGSKESYNFPFWATRKRR